MQKFGAEEFFQVPPEFEVSPTGDLPVITNSSALLGYDRSKLHHKNLRLGAPVDGADAVVKMQLQPMETRSSLAGLGFSLTVT